MGFDEKIGDHIPELVREFVTLCITEFVSVDGGDSTKSQRSKGDDWVSWNFVQRLTPFLLVISKCDDRLRLRILGSTSSKPRFV